MRNLIENFFKYVDVMRSTNDAILILTLISGLICLWLYLRGKTRRKGRENVEKVEINKKTKIEKDLLFAYLQDTYWSKKVKDEDDNKDEKSLDTFRPVVRVLKNTERTIHVIYSKNAIFKLAFDDGLQSGKSEELALTLKGLRSWSIDETRSRFSAIMEDLHAFRIELRDVTAGKMSRGNVTKEIKNIGEDLELDINGNPYKWKTATPGGLELEVPCLCFIHPTYEENTKELESNISIDYTHLLTTRYDNNTINTCEVKSRLKILSSFDEGHNKVDGMEEELYSVEGELVDEENKDILDMIKDFYGVDEKEKDEEDDEHFLANVDWPLKNLPAEEIDTKNPSNVNEALNKIPNGQLSIEDSTEDVLSRLNKVIEILNSNKSKSLDSYCISSEIEQTKSLRNEIMNTIRQTYEDAITTEHSKRNEKKSQILVEKWNYVNFSFTEWEKRLVFTESAFSAASELEYELSVLEDILVNHFGLVANMDGIEKEYNEVLNADGQLKLFDEQYEKMKKLQDSPSWSRNAEQTEINWIAGRWEEAIKETNRRKQILEKLRAWERDFRNELNNKKDWLQRITNQFLNEKMEKSENALKDELKSLTGTLTDVLANLQPIQDLLYKTEQYILTSNEYESYLDDYYQFITGNEKNNYRYRSANEWRIELQEKAFKLTQQFELVLKEVFKRKDVIIYELDSDSKDESFDVDDKHLDWLAQVEHYLNWIKKEESNLALNLYFSFTSVEDVESYMIRLNNFKSNAQSKTDEIKNFFLTFPDNILSMYPKMNREKRQLIADNFTSFIIQWIKLNWEFEGRTNRLNKFSEVFENYMNLSNSFQAWLDKIEAREKGLQIDTQKSDTNIFRDLKLRHELILNETVRCETHLDILNKQGDCLTKETISIQEQIQYYSATTLTETVQFSCFRSNYITILKNRLFDINIRFKSFVQRIEEKGDMINDCIHTHENYCQNVKRIDSLLTKLELQFQNDESKSLNFKELEEQMDEMSNNCVLLTSFLRDFSIKDESSYNDQFGTYSSEIKDLKVRFKSVIENSMIKERKEKTESLASVSIETGISNLSGSIKDLKQELMSLNKIDDVNMDNARTFLRNIDSYNHRISLFEAERETISNMINTENPKDENENQKHSEYLVSIQERIAKLKESLEEREKHCLNVVDEYILEVESKLEEILKQCHSANLVSTSSTNFEENFNKLSEEIGAQRETVKLCHQIGFGIINSDNKYEITDNIRRIQDNFNRLCQEINTIRRSHDKYNLCKKYFDIDFPNTKNELRNLKLRIKKLKPIGLQIKPQTVLSQLKTEFKLLNQTYNVKRNIDSLIFIDEYAKHSSQETSLQSTADNDRTVIVKASEDVNKKIFILENRLMELTTLYYKTESFFKLYEKVDVKLNWFVGEVGPIRDEGDLDTLLQRYCTWMGQKDHIESLFSAAEKVLVLGNELISILDNQYGILKISSILEDLNSKLSYIESKKTEQLFVQNIENSFQTILKEINTWIKTKKDEIHLFETTVKGRRRISEYIEEICQENVRNERKLLLLKRTQNVLSKLSSVQKENLTHTCQSIIDVETQFNELDSLMHDSKYFDRKVRLKKPADNFDKQKAVKEVVNLENSTHVKCDRLPSFYVQKSNCDEYYAFFFTVVMRLQAGSLEVIRNREEREYINGRQKIGEEDSCMENDEVLVNGLFDVETRHLERGLVYELSSSLSTLQSIDEEGEEEEEELLEIEEKDVNLLKLQESLEDETEEKLSEDELRKNGKNETLLVEEIQEEKEVKTVKLQEKLKKIEDKQDGSEKVKEEKEEEELLEIEERGQENLGSVVEIQEEKDVNSVKLQQSLEGSIDETEEVKEVHLEDELRKNGGKENLRVVYEGNEKVRLRKEQENDENVVKLQEGKEVNLSRLQENVEEIDQKREGNEKVNLVREKENSIGKEANENFEGEEIEILKGETEGQDIIEDLRRSTDKQNTMVQNNNEKEIDGNKYCKKDVKRDNQVIKGNNGIKGNAEDNLIHENTKEEGKDKHENEDKTKEKEPLQNRLNDENERTCKTKEEEPLDDEIIIANMEETSIDEKKLIEEDQVVAVLSKTYNKAEVDRVGGGSNTSYSSVSKKSLDENEYTNNFKKNESVLTVERDSTNSDDNFKETIVLSKIVENSEIGFSLFDSPINNSFQDDKEIDSLKGVKFSDNKNNIIEKVLKKEVEVKPCIKKSFLFKDEKSQEIMSNNNSIENKNEEDFLTQHGDGFNEKMGIETKDLSQARPTNEKRYKHHILSSKKVDLLSGVGDSLSDDNILTKELSKKNVFEENNVKKKTIDTSCKTEDLTAENQVGEEKSDKKALNANNNMLHKDRLGNITGDDENSLSVITEDGKEDLSMEEEQSQKSQAPTDPKKNISIEILSLKEVKNQLRENHKLNYNTNNEQQKICMEDGMEKEELHQSKYQKVEIKKSKDEEENKDQNKCCKEDFKTAADKKEDINTVQKENLGKNQEKNRVVKRERGKDKEDKNRINDQNVYKTFQTQQVNESAIIKKDTNIKLDTDKRTHADNQSDLTMCSDESLVRIPNVFTAKDNDQSFVNTSQETSDNILVSSVKNIVCEETIEEENISWCLSEDQDGIENDLKTYFDVSDDLGKDIIEEGDAKSIYEELRDLNLNFYLGVESENMGIGDSKNVDLAIEPNKELGSITEDGNNETLFSNADKTTDFEVRPKEDTKERKASAQQLATCFEGSSLEIMNVTENLIQHIENRRKSSSSSNSKKQIQDENVLDILQDKNECFQEDSKIPTENVKEDTKSAAERIQEDSKFPADKIYENPKLLSENILEDSMSYTQNQHEPCELSITTENVVKIQSKEENLDSNKSICETKSIIRDEIGKSDLQGIICEERSFMKKVKVELGRTTASNDRRGDDVNCDMISISNETNANSEKKEEKEENNEDADDEEENLLRQGRTQIVSQFEKKNGSREFNLENEEDTFSLDTMEPNNEQELTNEEKELIADIGELSEKLQNLTKNEDNSIGQSEIKNEVNEDSNEEIKGEEDENEVTLTDGERYIVDIIDNTANKLTRIQTDLDSINATIHDAKSLPKALQDIATIKEKIDEIFEMNYSKIKEYSCSNSLIKAKMTSFFEQWNRIQLSSKEMENRCTAAHVAFEASNEISIFLTGVEKVLVNQKGITAYAEDIEGQLQEILCLEGQFDDYTERLRLLKYTLEAGLASIDLTDIQRVLNYWETIMSYITGRIGRLRVIKNEIIQLRDMIFDETNWLECICDTLKSPQPSANECELKKALNTIKRFNENLPSHQKNILKTLIKAEHFILSSKAYENDLKKFVLYVKDENEEQNGMFEAASKSRQWATDMICKLSQLYEFVRNTLPRRIDTLTRVLNISKDGRSQSDESSQGQDSDEEINNSEMSKFQSEVESLLQWVEEQQTALSLEMPSYSSIDDLDTHVIKLEHVKTELHEKEADIDNVLLACQELLIEIPLDARENVHASTIELELQWMYLQWDCITRNTRLGWLRKLFTLCERNIQPLWSWMQESYNRANTFDVNAADISDMKLLLEGHQGFIDDIKVQESKLKLINHYGRTLIDEAEVFQNRFQLFYSIAPPQPPFEFPTNQTTVLDETLYELNERYKELYLTTLYTHSLIKLSHEKHVEFDRQLGEYRQWENSVEERLQKVEIDTNCDSVKIMKNLDCYKDIYLEIDAKSFCVTKLLSLSAELSRIETQYNFDGDWIKATNHIVASYKETKKKVFSAITLLYHQIELSEALDLLSDCIEHLKASLNPPDEILSLKTLSEEMIRVENIVSQVGLLKPFLENTPNKTNKNSLSAEQLTQRNLIKETLNNIEETLNSDKNEYLELYERYAKQFDEWLSLQYDYLKNGSILSINPMLFEDNLTRTIQEIEERKNDYELINNFGTVIEELVDGEPNYKFPLNGIITKKWFETHVEITKNLRKCDELKKYSYKFNKKTQTVFSWLDKTEESITNQKPIVLHSKTLIYHDKVNTLNRTLKEAYNMKGFLNLLSKVTQYFIHDFFFEQECDVTVNEERLRVGKNRIDVIITNLETSTDYLKSVISFSLSYHLTYNDLTCLLQCMESVQKKWDNVNYSNLDMACKQMAMYQTFLENMNVVEPALQYLCELANEIRERTENVENEAYVLTEQIEDVKERWKKIASLAKLRQNDVLSGLESIYCVEHEKLKIWIRRKEKEIRLFETTIHGERFSKYVDELCNEITIHENLFDLLDKVIDIFIDLGATSTRDILQMQENIHNEWSHLDDAMLNSKYFGGKVRLRIVEDDNVFL